MRRRRATWRHKLLAVGFGLTLVIGVPELIVRGAGWTPPPRYLEVVDVDVDGVATCRSVGKVRGLDSVCVVDPFPLAAAEGTLRVGAFGGSTTVGVPFSEPLRIWNWLEHELESRLPGVEIEPLVFGMSGANLHHVRGCAAEVPEGVLDLAIIYAGHNETLDVFVELERQRGSRGLVAGLLRAPFELRWVQCLCHEVLGIDPPAEITEVSAPSRITSDPADLELRNRMRVASADNLRATIERFRREGVPVLYVLPAANPIDTTPRVAWLDPDLPPEVSDRVRRDIDRAGALYADGAYGEALVLAGTVTEIVPDFALAHGIRARCLHVLGRADEALAAQRRSEDHDIRPMNVTSALRRRLRQAAEEAGASIIDAESKLRERHSSRWGELFVDGVHPSLEGQQVIASVIATRLRELDWPRPAAEWGQVSAPPAELLAAAERQRRKVAGEGVLLRLQYAVFGGADPRQIEGLVSEFERAIEFGSDHPKTHFGHGLALLLAGRTEDGVAVMAPVLEQNPDLAEALGVLVERSEAVRAAVVGHVPGY